MSFLRELSTRRSALAAPVILTAIALTILLAGCPEETSTPPAPTPLPYTCDFGTPVDGTTTEADTTGCQTCRSTHEFQDGATTGGPGVNCVAITAYVCENGIAIGDAAPSPNLTGCQSCTGVYALDAAEGGAGVSCVTPYVCENGTRVFDAAPTAGSLGCQMCNDGYTFDSSTPAGGVGATCVSTSYTCENGDPIPGTGTTANPAGCQSCNSNYVLSAAMGGEGVSCLSDMDNDDVADSADNCPNVPNTDQSAAMGATAGVACDTDIDDDDDGLIEIWSLEQLHNMRYNLAGTSYDDEEADTGTDADTGITTGAPTAATTDCTTATGGVYLCGYELMQDLDFDLDGDGSTVNPDGTLDTDDTATPHFVVADGGWEPVGNVGASFTNNNPFSAIFEGNGYIIRNLATRRIFAEVGLFGEIDSGAHIRNVGLVGGLVDVADSAVSGVFIGGLVGEQNGGLITGSYTTITVTARTNSGNVGGLVGRLSSGSIIASYAAGNTITGDDITESVGGLVGTQSNGSIIASYAIGDVDGGGGSLDTVGGLVGLQAGGTITASYATGNADGGDNDGVNVAPDYAGGLVGRQNGGSIFASYATGNADGGDRANYAGTVTGLQNGTIAASYGFGTPTNGTLGGVSIRPAGVTAATALTAANTAQCSNRTYTTSTACTSSSLAITAGAWDATEMECSAPATNPTAGVDYTTYTTMATCTAPGTKTAADTWSTWSNASDNTLNAWVFGTGVAPKLRYADYDGSGASTTDYCALFLSTVTCSATGDELPGQ